MNNYSKIIGKEWNTPVNKAQIKNNEPSPVEVNNEPTLIHPDAAVRMFKLLQEELWEYKEAYEMERESNTDKEILIKVIDAIFDMQYVLSGIIAQHGLSKYQDKFMEEIHRSNLTKIDGEIVMNELGKILKPSGYEKPNLKRILEEL